MSVLHSHVYQVRSKPLTQALRKAGALS